MKMNLFENLQNMQKSKKELKESFDLMTIDVDCEPFENDDEAEEFIDDIRSNYDLDVDYTEYDGYRGRLTVTGHPYEIKKCFDDAGWDDWFVDWEDDDDAKEQFMNITGEDEEGWESFLYESKIIKDEKDIEHIVENKEIVNEEHVVKDKHDVEVVTEGDHLGYDEDEVYEELVTINGAEFHVVITEDPDDEYYNVYINEYKLYLQEPKSAIKSFETLALDSAVDYYKDCNDLKPNN